MQAAPAQLVLVDESDTLTIRPAVATANDPIVCKEWDLGAPEIRSASSDRAGGDGTIDRAGFTGARTVTFDLVILGDYHNSPYAYVERLVAMTHPSRRPKLQITRNTPEAYGQTWEMELRGNPFSISYGRRAAALLELQLSFVAPLGYLVGDNQGYDSGFVMEGSGSNLTFPVTFPMGTGQNTTGNPSLTLHVGGSVPVHPIIYIFGPATNPEVRTDDGLRVLFDGLALSAGQFVQIDMAAGTVRLDGAPEASVYHLVDFTVSTFWQWLPGAHTVRYIATSGQMSVHWRDRRFTI